MPQLHLYVTDDIAETIRMRATARQLSVSRYLAEVVQREIHDVWPTGYFEAVVGGWRGDQLSRPPQGEFEIRDEL